MPQPAPRASLPDTQIEWPTWLLATSIYAGWATVVWLGRGLGAVAPLALLALLALLACWFMSLQHELLHGHPTRSRRINRLLGLAPLAVWYPYDIYRTSHVKHHRDHFLTQPGIDPESNYVQADHYRRLPGLLKFLRQMQRTALGRIVLGPAFVIIPTWLDIVRKPLRGDFSETASWLQHLALLAAMLWTLDQVAGVGPLTYMLAVSYPALGVAMLRSFYEHRPAADPAHRVVINEAAWPWRMLYLNNNYHSVHHEQPAMPWYRLRRAYLADRAGYLHRNGGFLVPGYGYLLRRFALTPIDSPVLDGDTPTVPNESGMTF